MTRRGGDLGLLHGAAFVVFQFLTELTRLFQKCRLSGSVFITLKKCKLLWTRQAGRALGGRAMPGPLPLFGHFRAEGPDDIRSFGWRGPRRSASYAGFVCNGPQHVRGSSFRQGSQTPPVGCNLL